VRFGGRTLSGLAFWAVVFAMAVQVETAWGQNAAPAAQNTVPAATTPAAAASATDLAGIWQGTLHIAQANKDLRAEIKIEKTGSGYKTTFYSVDQGGQPLVASKTAFENGTVTFTIDMAGLKYEGKMSADGKTINGNSTQGPMSLALNLVRTPPDAAWPIPEPIKPMAADANPGFDVATIKRASLASRAKGSASGARISEP